MGNSNTAEHKLLINSNEKSEISDPFIDKLQIIYQDRQSRALETIKKLNVNISFDQQNLLGYCEKLIEKAVERGNRDLLRIYIGDRETSLKTNTYVLVPRSETGCQALDDLRKYYLCLDIPDFVYDGELDYTFRYKGDNSFEKIVFDFTKYWESVHPTIKCDSFIGPHTIYMEFKLRT